MRITEVKSRWEHPSGARAYMKIGECIHENKPVNQANLHVRVPEEHQGKGIGKELLETAVSDLENANTRLEAKDRIHNAYVTLNVSREGMAAAKATYQGAGFQVMGNDGLSLLLRINLANYE
ncbi:GNAT family N-acetyltransferase [archaeon]